MGAWEHGSMGAWEHGSMGAWEHGRMGAWEHRSMEQGLIRTQLPCNMKAPLNTSLSLFYELISAE